MSIEDIEAAMDRIREEMQAMGDRDLSPTEYARMDQNDAHVRDMLNSMIEKSVEHRREAPDCTNFACAGPPVMMTTMAMAAAGHGDKIIALLWAAIARLTDAEVARAGDAG